MNDLLSRPNVILDSLTDGVYTCDRDRRIAYWSKSAERITGWPAEEVVGRRCLDGVLCHADKDGHRLCGEEFCPLHRAMITGTSSKFPLMVFAQGKDGRRLPMQAAVAPIRDATGAVVGGVETFRDMSAMLADLERAARIQSLALEHDLPADARIRFSTFYTPHDVVGGDYFAIGQLDPDHYAFLLADVMGHGVAAALYTMHLSSLWDRFRQLLVRPAEFAATMNNELAKVVKDESFASALCGVIDAAKKRVRFSAAGGPPMVLFRADGRLEQLESRGFPLGMVADADYQEVETACAAGDCLLMFSDGAVEVHSAQGDMLDVEGLARILKGLDYPQSPIRSAAVEEELLKFSNAIRLDDDLTLIEARFL